MFKSIGASHIGGNYLKNEDSILINDELGIYIIADGVGSYKNGEIASRFICEQIETCIKQGLSLQTAIKTSHILLQELIESKYNREIMAASVAVLKIDKDSYDIAWVGSTRIYHWDDGALILLTKDDSAYEVLLNNDYKKLEIHKENKKILTQAVGYGHIFIHHEKGLFQTKQKFMLTTDGFHLSIPEKILINNFKNEHKLENLFEENLSYSLQQKLADDLSLIMIEFY